jgi:hypothetical protein
MIDLPEAFDLLESAQSIADLQDIARRLSAEATTPGGIFYSHNIDSTTKSGPVAQSLATTLGAALLDKTPRGQFLSSSQFAEAFTRILERIVENTNRARVQAGELPMTIAEIADLRTEYLFKAGGDSLWAEASRTYAASVRGDVFALTPNALADRVWMVDEFRTLVMNERVTSINGTPRTELLQQYLVDPEAAKARVNEAARILLGTDGFKEVGSGQTGEKLYEFTREFAERARLNPENFRPYAEIGPTTGLTDYGYRDGHVTFREPGSTTFLDLINSRPVPTSPSWLERQMNSLRERVANNLAEAAKYDGWGPDGERASPNLARLSALGRALAHAGTVLMAYDIATTVNAAVKKFAANEIEAGSKLLAELAGRLTLGLRGRRPAAPWVRPSAPSSARRVHYWAASSAVWSAR